MYRLEPDVHITPRIKGLWPSLSLSKSHFTHFCITKYPTVRSHWNQMFIAESIWQEDVDSFFLNPLEKSLYHSPNSAEIHAYYPKSLFPVKRKKSTSLFSLLVNHFHIHWFPMVCKESSWESDSQWTRCAWSLNECNMCDELVNECLSWRNRDNGQIKVSLCVFHK